MFFSIYSVLGRVHVGMLAWVCVGILRHIVVLTWSHRKGVVISGYENTQTFKETENDSLFRMEEAEVCELL